MASVQMGGKLFNVMTSYITCGQIVLEAAFKSMVNSCNGLSYFLASCTDSNADTEAV
jgi:hypothetical protein